jgi:FG-GAP-like repeat
MYVTLRDNSCHVSSFRTKMTQMQLSILARIAAFSTIIFSSGAAADINSTTDRYVRDQYACMISTQDGLKPEFSETEYAWASWMTGLADLSHDGIPEVIAGYEHEYSPGYGPWTREIYQYGFYSIDPAFEAPPGTRFLAARTMLTQDFNNDGLDDVIFIQHGPDYEPYVPARNEILLSSPDGYQTNHLNGGSSLFHGGAAGDFDNDGDVDLVVTPGRQNEILVLYNDGSGSFPSIRQLTGFGRIYNIKSWDIDNDGNLDLIFDGQEEPLTVLWGDGHRGFPERTIVQGLNDPDLMQDAVFLERDHGGVDVIVNSSLSVNEPIPYQGYSLDRISFAGRNVVSVSNIDRMETPNTNLRVWLNFIHVCDLGSDGDLDVIFESFGANDRFISASADWIFLDRIVWEDLGDRFVRIAILDSDHRLVPDGFIPEGFFREAAVAERLGLSLIRYLPAQTYALTRVDQPFAVRHRRLIESIVNYQTINPSASWNSGAELSDRARRILEQRKEQKQLEN